MLVKDLVTADVQSCAPDTDLATAARIMWDCDCGAVPVINDEHQIVGMITDRDICIATATRAALPSDIRVRDVMASGNLQVCTPDDDVRGALQTMASHRVRRLPVVDRQRRLVGILSMNDLVTRAECRKGADIAGDLFLETLRSIGAHTSEPLTV